MYPHERSLVTRLEGQPFALIGVNSDRDRTAIRRIAEEQQLNWRSFWDGRGGPIAGAWEITSWPSIFVIDHEGHIRFENVRGAELDAAVDRLLAEM